MKESDKREAQPGRNTLALLTLLLLLLRMMMMISVAARCFYCYDRCS